MANDIADRVALVAGATGIAGQNLAAHLRQRGWKVYGLSRTPPINSGTEHISADLLDSATLRHALRAVRPSHIFITSWLRQPTEAENIAVNSTMVRNLLDQIRHSASVRHVALVTGLKHYLGPFESYGKGVLPATPFREDQPRLDVENFYYAQEDELFSAAGRDGFRWSVHRPHTMIGCALGNAMNMGVTLAVYASICRVTDRPFIFPGSAIQWNSLTDVTDARLLAKHLEWAATTDEAANQAFNVVNGDVFRWSWMWGRLAAWFGLKVQPFPNSRAPLTEQLQTAGPIWEDIAKTHSLVEPDISKLTSAWHTDADLGRPIEVVTDMSKSRNMGFREFQASDDSFFDLFLRLRKDRIIP